MSAKSLFSPDVATVIAMRSRRPAVSYPCRTDGWDAGRPRASARDEIGKNRRIGQRQIIALPGKRMNGVRRIPRQNKAGRGDFRRQLGRSGQPSRVPTSFR